MDRRLFLRTGSIALTALALLPVSALGDVQHADNYPPLQDYVPVEIVLAIGAGYLKLHPDFSGSGLDDLDRSQVVARVQQEFVNDKTVIAGGWLVSETEARLCAMAVLKGN